MPTQAAAEAVVTLLDTVAASTGHYEALTAGANLLLGPVRSPEDGCPRKAVFVELVSESSARFCGSSSDWIESNVQVTVRGDRSDYAGVEALATACRNAIHCATASGYTSVTVEAGPYSARVDPTGGPMWILLVRLNRAT